MYSLTIHFGPNAMVWTLLFKEQEKAAAIYNTYVTAQCEHVDAGTAPLIGADDFGQSFAIPLNDIHGIMLEDLEAVMEARIFRSLDNARGEIKAKQRAFSDPVIRAGQTMQPGVIAPNFRSQ